MSMPRGAMKSKRQQQDDESFGAGLPKRPRTLETSFGPLTHSHGNYTIAWICVLPLELAASRAMLDEEHLPLPNQPGDDNTYVLGRIHRNNVVMACLPAQCGTNNAATVAANLKQSFPRIRASLIVGVSSASPRQADLFLGDVVVGTRVMQYDLGRVVGGGGGGFEGTAIPMTPAPLLNAAVSALRSKHTTHRPNDGIAILLQNRLPNLSRPDRPDRLFQASYEHHPPGAPTCGDCDPQKLQPRARRLDDNPKIHYGVIASGSSVIQDGNARDDIAQPLDALCFDTEAAAMMDSLQCLPIRGICDYSDSHKNKEWLDYAATTAAAYARELLGVIPPSSGELSRADALRVNTASEPDTTSSQASERRQRLLESLNFAQIDPRKTTIRTPHTKTCRWFVRHPAMQSNNHGLLWMQGKAGAGKSTLMMFAYLESKKKDGSDIMTACFFFNARGSDLETSITGMYRSLLLQLLNKFPDLQSTLDDTDIIPSSQEICPDLDTLKALLSSALFALGKRSVTCFIDAADECDEQGVRDMIHCFEDLAEKTAEASIKLRICFASRPHPYISVRNGVSLALEDESGHAADLAQYVKSNLAVGDPALQSQILGKASGNFLWIVLVVNLLNKEYGGGGRGRRGALSTKLSKIPDKLNDLFKSILTRDQKSPKLAMFCVLWILCAKRPLTPAEFRHAVWVASLDQQSDEEDFPADSDVPDVSDMQACVVLVTDSLGGLAEITKSKNPTVQFGHESVRDFLVKDGGLYNMWPELGLEWEAASQERLRRCCTRYLSLPIVHPIVDKPMDESARDALAQEYPLLEYASEQVLPHADAAAALGVPQDSFLSEFFDLRGIRVVNLFERYKSRRYCDHAPPIYILADRGLGNLIRTWMNKGSPEQESAAAYICGERYRYPFFAALANGHKYALAALLGLSSTTSDGVDTTEEGFTGMTDLTGHKTLTPLTWAAREGTSGIAKALIAQGAAVDDLGKNKATALIEASSRGHEAVVRLLIASGADLDARNKDGETALIRALEHRHAAVARLLIDSGADVNASSWRYRDETTLKLALRNGDEAIVRLLAARGADTNARDTGYTTALERALRSGDETTTRLLIAVGADVNTRTRWGSMALMWASEDGHEAMARLLIDSGADLNAGNNAGTTALMFASTHGHEAVVRLLIDSGADVNALSKDGSSALKGAAGGGHAALVRFLLDNGADINGGDEKISPPLVAASGSGHEAVVRLLIDSGADAKKYGGRALMSASEGGHEAVLKLLIARGANVNGWNEHGRPLLLWALQRPLWAAARVLIDAGADINGRDGYGWTALKFAAYYGNMAMARLLVERGADVNDPGQTALMWASEKGFEGMVQYLLGRGADINARDEQGRLALDYARTHRKLAMVQFLTDKAKSQL